MFDDIIIGTSPACIFEMASRQSLGRRTLMIDREHQIGGAWSTIDHPILGQVETGAHFLTADDRIYDFFEKTVGVPLELLHQPKYFFPRKVFGRNYTSWLNRWGSGVSEVSPDFPRSIRSWRSLVSPYYRMLMYLAAPKESRRKPVKYFRMGTLGLLPHLQRFIEKHALNVKLGQTVTRIDVDSAAKLVTVRTGEETFTAQKFVLTSCAVIDEIYLDNTPIQLPTEPRPLLQLHLTLKGPAIKNLSFGQYSSSKYIRLTGNLTPYLSQENRDAGYSLVTNLVHEDLPETEEVARQVIAEHIAHGVITEEHECVNVLWRRYDSYQRQDDELAEIKDRFAPYIDVMPTHAFCSTMAARVTEWRSALDGAVDRSVAVAE
jgi:hypothetical protein